MKTPFLHLARRLAHATPASWFPSCLEEATGYAPQHQLLATGAVPAHAAIAPRSERLRHRALASAGALFAAPGYPPYGALVVLPAADDLRPLTAADALRAQLVAEGRALLDAALADPRLLAHLELGAPATSIAGMAGLQFLRDRHALAVGHFWRGETTDDGGTRYDAGSLCVQVAGVPANLALWLAAGIAARAGVTRALVVGEDGEGCWSLVQRRPAGEAVH